MDTFADQAFPPNPNGATDAPTRPSAPTSPQTHKGSISSSFNPRSCVTCRKRKVKCDKRHPCTNCTKARIECVFPSPGRAPRKARKPPDAELLERLRKLEGVVKTLGGAAVDGQSHTVDGQSQAPAGNSGDQATQCSNGGGTSVHHESHEYIRCPRGEGYLPPEDTSLAGLETRFGRLVVNTDEGRSRYVNSNFWGSLNNEVEDIKGLLTQASDDEDDYPSPESDYTSRNPNHQGFVFGFSSINVDMASLHPPVEHCRTIWELFKENVDPLVKILHIPTAEPKILEAMENREHIPKGMEPLLFSIYYAVITSTSAQECENRFGEEKQALLAKYRFGLEQGLARANFLQSDEWIVLQAFVIFLIALRRNEDARIIWTLTGLIVRMSQTLGLHRDGSHFGLSPFAIEMRRRLWWQVTILDTRSSEDNGCDPTITEASFDTQMPLNVNDEDLHPNMTEAPKERLGCTEMTFGLIRFEVSNVFRRIQYVPPAPNSCSRYFSSVSLEQKEKWIKEMNAKIEERYLQHSDMSVPLYWVIATVSRLIMSKMWLMIYHPYQRLDGGASLPQETKDRLFLTSLENVEYSLLLEDERRTEKWGWLFRTYNQWHAIAYLLTELCVRTKGPLVERAWRAVEIMASRRWADANSDQKGNLWRPLRKLVATAKAAREKEIEKERAEIAEAQAQAQLQALTSQAPLGMDLFPQTQTTGMACPDMMGCSNAMSTSATGLNGASVTSSMPDYTQGLLNQTYPQQHQHPNLHLTTQMQTSQAQQQQQQPQQPMFDMTSLDWLLKDPHDMSSPNSSAGPGTVRSSSGGAQGGGNAGGSSGSASANNAASAGIGTGSTTSPTTTAPNGSSGAGAVDWTSWDELVAQFSMDNAHAHLGQQGHQQRQGQGEGGGGAGIQHTFAPSKGFEPWY